MTRFKRLYFYAVLGSMGGLISWQISNLVGLSLLKNIYLADALVGGLIGLCFGLLIGVAEGVFVRSVGYALRAGAVAGALGLIAGAIGLPLSEGLFLFLGGQPWTRVLGWGVFGALVGLGVGITSGSQAWKPALGGLLGGALGGALLVGAASWLDNSLWGKGIGLTLLGASLGVFIALIVLLLSRAWLEVTSGKLKGSEFILDKFVKSGGPTAFIGSNALKADIVLPDPDIDAQHALLSGGDTYMSIKDMSLSGTYVNGRKVEQSRLANAQTIRVGNTGLVYHEKR